MATASPAGKTGGASTGFVTNRRIGAAKAKEITTVEDFTVGYRSREDISLLKPQTLCPGSHDVLTNVSGRVGSRMGYTIDGAASSVVAPISSSYDWETAYGYIHHFRAGFNSSGSNGKIQLRTVSTAGVVTWVDFITGLTSAYCTFAPIYDTASFQEKIVISNRTGTLYEWNGGYTTVGSATTTTLTTASTLTFAQQGFQQSFSVLGDGTTTYGRSGSGTVMTYTYSSGTDPHITTSTMPVGTIISIPSGSEAGQHVLTAVGSDTFSFASLSTVGTGYTGAIEYDYGYNSGIGYFILINGISYTYLGGALTTTLTGVSTLPALTAGTPFWQSWSSSLFSSYSFTNISVVPPPNYTVDIINVIQTTGQMMFASISSNLIYLSQAGNYKSMNRSTARVQLEGALFTTTNGVTNAMVNQEGDMYVSAGLDQWYLTSFIQTTTTDSNTGTTTVFETANLVQLKTSSQQATVSQYATTKIKDDIVFISNEPILNSLGRVDNILVTPQITDLSYPIVNDMNGYNFGDSWVVYNKLFIYMGVPKQGIFRMYNMTNPKNPYWEAPINIALSGLSFVGNTIIGHSYQTSESYIMFNGYSDRAASINQTGNPISAVAVFPMQVDALRAKRKSFNKFFTEGYMTPGTKITVNLFGRSPNPGVTPLVSYTLNGTAPYVLNYDQSSIGKNDLGKNPLAGTTQTIQQGTLPPYFAVNQTFVRFPYLSYQPSISSYGVNQNWQLLSFGNNSAPTSENETDLNL